MPPKRRRRFQGLYYHSSPPKVLSMNGQVSNLNLRKRRDVDDFSVKLSTIRIWMHEKDIGKLTRILWAGQGNRLRQQASTNAKVKRFLAAVPYVMNSIKDVHQAVIDNSLETLQAHLEPPVPPALITCKDANGLNVIHKAAGMGHAMILEYLIGVWPDGAHETDITGKTPLHWAASCKNNMRCYTLLTQAGCDEEAQDYKMKTPSYYRHKPHEIERAFLVFVPEAPRVSPDIATDWEALSEDAGDGKKLDIKIPDAMTNGFHERSNDTASEPDLIEGENEMHEVEVEETPENEVEPKEDDEVAAPTQTEETSEEVAEEKVSEADEPAETAAEEAVKDAEAEAEDADEENISNDMNETARTAETNMAEHKEEEHDEDGQQAENDNAQPEVETNTDEKEKALENNKDADDNDEVIMHVEHELEEMVENDKIADEVEIENDEKIVMSGENDHEELLMSEELIDGNLANNAKKLEDAAETHDSEEKHSDKSVENDDNNEAQETVNEDSLDEKENEVELTTDELDETIRVEEIRDANTIMNDEKIVNENETKENAVINENIHENDTTKVNDIKDINFEDFDVEKNGNKSDIAELAQQIMEIADDLQNLAVTPDNNEDSKTNEIEKTDNDGNSKTSSDTKDNVEMANEENEVNNNGHEKVNGNMEATLTTKDIEETEEAEETTKATRDNAVTTATDANANHSMEIVDKMNAENTKRTQSASLEKSPFKQAKVNGAAPTTPKATTINGKHVSSTDSEQSSDEDDDQVQFGTL